MELKPSLGSLIWHDTKRLVMSLRGAIALAFSLMILAVTPFNPMALGYRIVAGEASFEAASYPLVYSLLLFGSGLLWFRRKDL